MLAPLYAGDPSLPLPAMYKLPDELWLIILSHIPHIHPYTSPNLSYDDAFHPPSPDAPGARELRSAFQAENRFIELQYRAWLRTMQAALSVNSGWYAELRPSLDRWVLFRSPGQVRAFLRSRPIPVESMGIERLDVHYEESFPNELLEGFLAQCTGLEQLRFNQLNNYLSVDIPVKLLQAAVGAAGPRLRSVGFPKREMPVECLPLLASLEGLEQLSIGAEKDSHPSSSIPPLLDALSLSSPSTLPFGSNITSLRIDLPVLSRASSLLLSLLPASALPRLKELTLTTPETPYRLPSSSLRPVLPFSPRAVEPFFAKHGAKLDVLRFWLAEGHGHGHLCRVVSLCPNLKKLAIPACEHTREAVGGWAAGKGLAGGMRMREVALGNFLGLAGERGNVLREMDHWRSVVGVVGGLVGRVGGDELGEEGGSGRGGRRFPKLERLRLADVLPPRATPAPGLTSSSSSSAPGPAGSVASPASPTSPTSPISPTTTERQTREQAYYHKLLRKVLTLCEAEGVDVVDSAGGRITLPSLEGEEGFGGVGELRGRWPLEGGRVGLK